MELKKENILRNRSYVRNLFGLCNFDVTAYSDDAIADAVLEVCPIVGENWPTHEQLTLVFERLQDARDA
jgi:hypothetical protein